MRNDPIPHFDSPIRIPVCTDGRIEYMYYFAHKLLFSYASVHEKVPESGTKVKAVRRLF